MRQRFLLVAEEKSGKVVLMRAERYGISLHVVYLSTRDMWWDLHSGRSKRRTKNTGQIMDRRLGELCSQSGRGEKEELCFFSACVMGLASVEPSPCNLRFS